MPANREIEVVVRGKAGEPLKSPGLGTILAPLMKLLWDPFVWASLILLGLSAGAYVVNASRPFGAFGGLIGTVNVALLGVALLAVLMAEPLGERANRVRLSLVVAYAFWLAVELGPRVLSDVTMARPSAILVDVGYLVFYYLMYTALRYLRKIDRFEALSFSKSELLEHLEAAPFYIGILVYFVVIPLRFDPQEFDALLPSSLFYSMLDVWLAAACLWVFLKIESGRWKLFALLMLLAFSGWATIDIFNSLALIVEKEIQPWGDPSDFVWFAGLVAAVAANRLIARAPTAAVGKQDGAVGAKRHGQTLPTGPAFVLTLIVFHFVGYRLGRLSPESQDSREIVVALLLGVTVIALFYRYALAQSDSQFRLLVDESPDSIILTDSQGTIEYVNKAFSDLTGFSQEDAVGRTPRILKSGHHDEAFFRDLWGTILRGEVFNGLLVNRRKDGTIYYEERVITAVRNPLGAITRFMALGRDITQRIEDEAKLHHIANHDVLTGLPNRSFLFQRLEHTILTSKRHRRRFSIFLVDLDDFKAINDSRGHLAGDEVLRVVSRRLAENIRDIDTVARIGGDEMVIISDESADPNDLVRFARRLADSISQPIVFEQEQLVLTASIGIAVFPEDGTSAEKLIGSADVAMYAAKEIGPGRYRLHNPEMRRKSEERLAIVQHLRSAEDRDEFRLVFQPVVNLQTGRVESLEALLRWTNPDLGEVPPGKFIRRAEAAGLMPQLGRWGRREACSVGAQWVGGGREYPGISVNVSPLQLEDRGFVTDLVTILEETGFPVSKLVLELTEGTLLSENSEVTGALDQLEAMGVGVFVDGFGTGYSSLAYLSKVRPQGIKIDRSFVAGSECRKDMAEIIEGVVHMGHACGAAVIAEGVETSGELDVVRRAGCDAIQGFLCSRPLEVEAVFQFLADGPFPKTPCGSVGSQ